MSETDTLSGIRRRRAIWIAVAIVIFLGAVVAIVGGPWNSPTETDKLRVAVTQIATHPGIDMVRQGFLHEMERLGFKDGENVEYDFTNANGQFAVAQSIAQRYAAGDFDLIFSISTPSTQAIKDAMGTSDVPVVFGAITDPVSAGVVDSLQHPGGNITGTSDVWPYEEQFELLRRLVDPLQRVGVVHNPGESNAAYSVGVVKQVAHRMGLELVLVPVTNTNEVAAAARSLIGRVDAIYIPADNTVIAALGAMIAVSEQHGIPLMPGDTSNVAQGGFGTIGHDYASIGAESARMAKAILDGASPADLPVRTSTVHEYYFNLRSARATGVLITQAMLEKAKVVYGRSEDQP